MATNRIGSGSVNLTVNVPAGLRQDLGNLADRSGVKLSEYCRRVLASAVRNKVVYESRPVMLRESPVPYGDEMNEAAQAAARFAKENDDL